jgi:membrane-bound lytic murein transglycosylase D
MHFTHTFRLAIALAIHILCFSEGLHAQAFSDTFEQDLEDGMNITYAPTDESELQLRVMNLDGPIQGYWGEDVKKLIQHRLKQREFTQQLLGRTVLYGSFIEKALIENNLPVELQNLCIVESALNPKIVSHAGAAGLWQLMPETAKEMGLKVTSTIDERFDPYKSTQAATKYLKMMYDQFHDWGLALAAYNAGPYKINSVLKQAGAAGTDYWSIRKYLKPETQNYVPAFLAMTYVMQYYPWHNLKPQLPNLDMQITEAVTVKEQVSFQLISQVTEIPVATIQVLNPSFTKDYVPENANGNFLVLPKRVAKTFMDYVALPREARPDLNQKPVLFTASVNPNTYYEKIKITIGANDNVHNLAQAFNCSALNIRSWNQLASYYVAQGQQLRIFVPRSSTMIASSEVLAAAALKTEIKNDGVLKVVPTVDKREKVEDILAMNAVVRAEINPNEKPKETTIERLKKITTLKEIDGNQTYLYHYFGRNESLVDIAEKYGITSVKEILDLNQFDVTDVPIVGAKLKIKVL